MKALKITLLEPSSIEPVRALSRGLGRFIFSASVLMILFAGTFPFDFTYAGRNIAPFDTRWMQYDPNYTDRGQNVLFFLPFGFGFAAIIRTQFNRARWRMGAAPAVSLALSLLVEINQQFVSFRDPCVMDLWTNTLGGTIGAGVYVLVGDRLLAAAARGMLRMRRFASPALAGAAMAGYALLHLSGPLLLRDPGDLSVWDPNLPLVVGNEEHGERPWTGSLEEIILADRAISPTEALRLFQQEPAGDILQGSLLGHYRPAGQAPYPDRTGQLPPLEWVGVAPTTGPSQPPAIDPTRWLSTTAPISPAIQRIRESSQLTLAATVSTPSTDQRGPVRMLAISSGPTSRNIQLWQEFAYLVVRVRSAIRSAPELYLHNVFAPGTPRQIIVTTRDAETVVYIDGLEEGRMRITPEAKVIWRLYPRAFRIRLEEYGFRAYAAIYRAIVFIPFAALLGATLLLLHWPPAMKVVLAVGSLVGLAVLIEVVLGQLGGRFEPINFLISLVIGFGTLAGLILWRRVRDTYD